MRMQGALYTNCAGKEVAAKESCFMENCGCIFQCHKKINESQQKQLFINYMAMGSMTQRKMYLSGLIMQKSPTRERPRKNDPKKEKKNVRKYFLEDAEGERHRVCKKFFLFVFQISNRVTDDVLKRRLPSGTLVYAEHGLTTKKPANATPPDKKKHVLQHINSFLKIPSHYCWKKSSKVYLSPELNTSKLYELYVQKCTEDEVSPVSEFVYRSIFKSFKPPLSTYKPKKDQCSVCNQYNESDKKDELKERYQKHKKHEADSLKMNSEDMNAHQPEHKVFTFDLEAILPLPYAGDAQIYYKRKLSSFNITIFDDNKNGICFIWDETHGKKGSNEIATCLVKYIESLPADVKEVTGWCDTCAGQNRNQYLIAALIYTVNSNQSNV